MLNFMATLTGLLNSKSLSPATAPVFGAVPSLVACTDLLASIASDIFVARLRPSTEPSAATAIADTSYPAEVVLDDGDPSPRAAGLVSLDEPQAPSAVMAETATAAVTSLRFTGLPRLFRVFQRQRFECAMTEVAGQRDDESRPGPKSGAALSREIRRGALMTRALPRPRRAGCACDSGPAGYRGPWSWTSWPSR